MRGEAIVQFLVEARGAAAYFTRDRTFPLHKKLPAASINNAEVEKMFVRVFFNHSHLEECVKLQG